MKNKFKKGLVLLLATVLLPVNAWGYSNSIKQVNQGLYFAWPNIKQFFEDVKKDVEENLETIKMPDSKWAYLGNAWEVDDLVEYFKNLGFKDVTTKVVDPTSSNYKSRIADVINSEDSEWYAGDELKANSSMEIQYIEPYNTTKNCDDLKSALKGETDWTDFSKKYKDQNVSFNAYIYGTESDSNGELKNIQVVYGDYNGENANARPVITIPANSSRDEGKTYKENSNVKIYGKITASESPTLTAFVIKDRESDADVVTLGNFNNKNLKWYVIDRSDGNALLLCKSIVNHMAFKDSIQADPSDWSGSDIRAWLANDFYQNAFSDSEKQAISLADVTDFKSDNVEGNITQDYVFILNKSQYENLQDNRKKASEQWWLIDSYCNDLYKYSVLEDGSLWEGPRVNEEEGVRPAMWVNMELCGIK